MADMGAHGIGWVHYDTNIPYGGKGWYNGLVDGNISKMEIVTHFGSSHEHSVLESFNLSLFLEHQARKSLINDYIFIWSHSYQDYGM